MLAQTKPYSQMDHGMKDEWKTNFTKKRCMRVLIDYLEHDFADVKKNLDLMLGSGVITFELLWALWKPYTLIYAPCHRAHLIPGVSMVSMAVPPRKDVDGLMQHYTVYTKYVDFNGETLD